MFGEMQVNSGGGSVQEDLLWTWSNASNPSAVFDHENISIAYNDYDLLKIECRYYNQSTTFFQYVNAYNIANGNFEGLCCKNGSSYAFRSVTKVSDGVVEVNRAYPINGSASSGVNTVFTPIKIYGVKLPS